MLYTISLRISVYMPITNSEQNIKYLKKIGLATRYNFRLNKVTNNIECDAADA